jgi:hypothetical protein
VADADVISAFWDGTMCRTLVHKLGCEQPKTTKELVYITMQHTSGEEAVGAAFVLGNARVAANGGRAVLTEATIKGARKGTKGSKKGLKRRPHHVTIAAGNEGGDKEAGNSDEDCVATAKRDFKQ